MSRVGPDLFPMVLAGHLVGDFIVQTDWQAANKEKDWRRLPEDNVRRFRNRLRGLRDRWRAGSIERREVVQRINSWVAHARHADTTGLRHAIFRGGWFDPQFGPSARWPGRPAAPSA